MDFANNDIYAEWLVKRKDSPYLILIYIGGGLLLAAAFALMCFWKWGFTVFIVAAFAAFVGRRYLHLEYEYTFVTTELTVDRIYSQAVRRKAVSVEMHDVHSVEKTDRAHIEQLKENKEAGILDFTSLEESDDLWLISYTDQEKGEMAIAFEPNEKLLHAMWKSAPGKVHISLNN